MVAPIRPTFQTFVRCPRCDWEAFSADPPRDGSPDLDRLRDSFLMHAEMRHDLSTDEALMLLPVWLHGPIARAS